MIKGDVVNLRGRHGYFVYAGARPGEIPPNTQGKFVNVANQSVTCGIEMATLTVSPSFTVGEVLQFQGGSATVVSDGPDLVALTYETGRCDADRTELVRQNLSRFI